MLLAGQRTGVFGEMHPLVIPQLRIGAAGGGSEDMRAGRERDESEKELSLKCAGNKTPHASDNVFANVDQADVLSISSRK